MSEGFARGHALVIGVGADLPNTVSDAEGLADLLQDPARCAYPSAQVSLLTAGKATRVGILAGLEALTKAVGEEDTVIVYFSGHGYRLETPFGTQYFLMPYGYDIKDLLGTAIEAGLFLQMLRQMRAQKMLLLLDCCYAGGLEDAKAPGFVVTKAALPPDAQARLSEGKGRLLIASSRDAELSYAGKPYSMFTLALLEALCGAGASHKDGYVRVTDVAMHTGRMVPQRTKDLQHPVFDFKGADNFELAYYAGGEAETKGLPFTQPAEVESQPGQFAPIDPPLQIHVTTTIDNRVDNSTHTTNIDNRGSVNQSGWQIGGNVVQTGGDSFHAGGDIHIYQGQAPPAPTPTPRSAQKTSATKLSGAQVRELHQALLSAFPSAAALRMFVQLGLDESLDAIAGGNDLSSIVFNLIQWTTARGRIMELITQASLENPTNPDLTRFVDSLP